MGADGLARPFVQIFQGDGNRQWFEAIYQDESMHPLAGIRTLIPERPNEPAAILDAAIVFAPRLFDQCSTLASVTAQLVGTDVLDFNIGTGVPREWKQLRREALPILQGLNVFEARIAPLAIGTIGA